jgi:hypothetical protein
MLGSPPMRRSLGHARLLFSKSTWVSPMSRNDSMNEAPKAESSQGNNFDLARLKRLFGPPVLLGNERMKDFDEYATEILTDQEPGGAVMATLVWQYIVESWDRMRLMRYQSRTVQGKILSARSQLNSTSQRDGKRRRQTASKRRSPLMRN